MELLLNLVWLMLAVPALVLSQRARRSAEVSGQVYRTNSLVLVVCLLLLLFPVVSATDDFLALGLDMEESATKSLVKQSVGPKAPVSGDDARTTAQLHDLPLYAPDNEHKAVSTDVAVLPRYTLASTVGCRAPPCPKPSAFVAPLKTSRFPILKLDFILWSRVVLTTGLQAEPPQASVAPDGLRSFKCKTHLLTARGNIPVVPRRRTQIRRQLPRDLTFQLLGQEESS